LKASVCVNQPPVIFLSRVVGVKVYICALKFTYEETSVIADIIVSICFVVRTGATNGSS
jgi:hypothetical protein